ncbi:MAG: hypothetical protein ABIL49_03945 [candidate division WOR-3 bacterium]|jgi:hypothetical protein
MIDFEPIETFLNSREIYLIKFSRILNMYKEKFRREVQREDIRNWEEQEFLTKIRKSYNFLKLNFRNLIENFYRRTNFEVINFQFIPFVGLGVVSEWVDVYKNQICSFIPLESIKNVKSLIVLVYKTYAIGYILNINTEIFKLNFYNNFRNLLTYGFGNYIATICSNYNVLIPIWQSQRSIYKIWLKDLEKNLKYYSFKFLTEIEDSSFVQFQEWFLISRRGQYIGYKLFEYANLKSFLNLNIEIYKLKFYEFYEIL